ncbi:MAG: hypothetical protein JW820_13970 [Spirochaetales bacterium]|nr:hypothetical protein [Spirochaetales bacterium]
MSMRTRIMERFGAARTPAGGPTTKPESAGPDRSTLFLPDLSLWYRWHKERGTFPPGWEGESLPEICRRRGLPIWLPVRPWRLEYQGLTVQTSRSEDVRETRWQTSAGTLLARWTLGPDGDWWQTDYPASSADLLPGAREIVQSIVYHPDPSVAEQARQEVREDGVVALELPMRSLSDLLHSFLGWSDGLLLLWEQPDAVQELARILEEKLQELLSALTAFPGDLYLSPDNLDGQFVSPDMFAEYLAPSYQAAATLLAHKPLVVHAGGPLRALLPKLGGCGVAAVEGVSGPPQSDATLAEAREAAGPGLTLWGGIAQDSLLPTVEQEDFESALAAALEQARQPGMVLGIADRVPPDALPQRLDAVNRAAS